MESTNRDDLNVRLAEAYSAAELKAQSYRSLGFWGRVWTVAIPILLLAGAFNPLLFPVAGLALIARLGIAVARAYYRTVYEIPDPRSAPTTDREPPTHIPTEDGAPTSVRSEASPVPPRVKWYLNPTGGSPVVYRSPSELEEGLLRAVDELRFNGAIPSDELQRALKSIRVGDQLDHFIERAGRVGGARAYSDMVHALQAIGEPRLAADLALRCVESLRSDSEKGLDVGSIVRRKAFELCAAADHPKTIEVAVDYAAYSNQKQRDEGAIWNVVRYAATAQKLPAILEGFGREPSVNHYDSLYHIVKDIDSSDLSVANKRLVVAFLRAWRERLGQGVYDPDDLQTYVT